MNSESEYINLILKSRANGNTGISKSTQTSMLNSSPAAYYASRILLETDVYVKEDDSMLPSFLRTIYLHKRPIPPSGSAFKKLIRAISGEPVQPKVADEAYRMIVDNAHTLSDTGILINKDLLWDKNSGRLRRY